MEEVTDEPLYRDRVCGIDIGNAGLVATIRVPSEKDPARRAAETRSFGTTKRGAGAGGLPSAPPGSAPGSARFTPTGCGTPRLPACWPRAPR